MPDRTGRARKVSRRHGWTLPVLPPWLGHFALGLSSHPGYRIGTAVGAIAAGSEVAPLR